MVERGDTREALLSVQPSGAGAATLVVRDEEPRGDRSKTYRTKVAELSLPVTLAAGGSDEIVVKLPSPAVSDADRDKLLALDFASARGETLRFWSDQQGAELASRFRSRWSTTCSGRTSGMPCDCRAGTAARRPG